MHDAIVTAAPTGVLTDVTLYLSAGNYYSGNIVMSGLSITTTVSGHIKITFKATGNGALSYN